MNDERILKKNKMSRLKDLFITKTGIDIHVWILKLFIPAFLIFFFSIALYVVVCSSFDYQYRMKVTLNTLKMGQQRSVRLLSEMRFLRSRIAEWELYAGGYNPVQDIEEMMKEMEQLKFTAAAFANKQDAALAADIAWEELKAYRNCLKERPGQLDTAHCSKKYDISSIEQLVIMYSEVIKDTVIRDE